MKRERGVGQARSEWTFHISGGRLCLDFANTVSWRASGRSIERLGAYSDLLSWSRQTGVLTHRETRALARRAARRRAEAARALKDAVTIRELIYRLFSATLQGRAPASTDVEWLSARLAESLGRMRLVAKGSRFTLQPASRPEALDHMLGPIVRSAAELLMSDRLSDVRKCAAASCGWIFLDTTRNRSRRWCDMRVCGNRAKARRHYERAKE